MRLFSVFVYLLLSVALQAQTFSLSGVVVDAKDKSPLVSATVSVLAPTDSSIINATVTDAAGRFVITGLTRGNFLLRVSYTGYSVLQQAVSIETVDKNLGLLTMEVNTKVLKDVTIVENQIRVEQRADTTEYNANAYKTNPDATAEDLVKKMPGITSDGGTVKAQGEEVKKVLVDGKEFFGDDANMALKNLPAEIIDKVQVFDKMSDQSQFTKFDDGNSQKAINVVTKKGKNNGLFGKFYAGYGYLNDHRYAAGATLNWFKADRRVSFIGMSNNTNYQNFSAQDLLGVMGGGQLRGAGGSRGGGGYGGMGGNFRGGGSGDFLVGAQKGISNTHSAGINYTDMWGKKMKVTGSYFFNLAANNNRTDITRQYFNRGDSSSVYNEANTSSSNNLNHRLNFRWEYNIDTNNAIIFTPKFSWQQNEQTNNLTGITRVGENLVQSTTQSSYYSFNKGYNLSADLQYQHKFKVSGRTLSMNVTGTVNNKNGNTSQTSLNVFTAQNDSVEVNQRATTGNFSYSANGSISYTEPVAEIGNMEFSYQPSYSWTRNNVNTNKYDTLSDLYTILDTSLSNQYEFSYMKHIAGIRYRINTEKITAMLGVNLQYALLDGKQVFPYLVSTKKDFKNALPSFMFNYKFNATSNIRIYYRTSTNAPSISQLQNVVDNSNPLLLRSGNPDLKQNYSHFLMVRYGLTNTTTAHSFFVFASANYTQNYIANATIIATKDTLLNGHVLLRTGSQYTQPVNLNGNLSVNSFFTYALPLKKIKSNLNLNTGLTYTLTPGLINNIRNLSNTYNVNVGGVLSSNISEKLDFTISYSANYNIVRNSIQTNGNNNYFYHTAGITMNWNFWKGFVFNTNLQNVLYTGIAQGFNQNYLLWNAELGYKFMKEKSLEVKFGAYDMLNQNNGISRTVTETYVEDSRTLVLKRYLLLTVTYNLRYFKK
jgi:hypothetical protein